MTCDAIREDFCEYLDDLLEPAQKERIAAHLAACSSCRQEVAQLQSTLDWLKQAEDVSPPADLRQNVLAELAQPHNVGSRRFASGLFQFVAAAAVFLLLVAANILPLQQSDSVAGDDGSFRTLYSSEQMESSGLDGDNSFGLEAEPQLGTMDDNNAVDGNAAALDSVNSLNQGERADSNRQFYINLTLILLIAVLLWWAVKKRREAWP